MTTYQARRFRDEPTRWAIYSDDENLGEYIAPDSDVALSKACQFTGFDFALWEIQPRETDETFSAVWQVR